MASCGASVADNAAPEGAENRIVTVAVPNGGSIRKKDIVPGCMAKALVSDVMPDGMMGCDDGKLGDGPWVWNALAHIRRMVRVVNRLAAGAVVLARPVRLSVNRLTPKLANNDGIGCPVADAMLARAPAGPDCTIVLKMLSPNWSPSQRVNSQAPPRQLKPPSPSLCRVMLAVSGPLAYRYESKNRPLEKPWAVSGKIWLFG